MPGACNTLRLYPLPAAGVGGPYEDLELPPENAGDTSRPYVVINMVSSVDGRASTEGKASGLGSVVDRRAMRTLRSRADAVMIGAATLRAERLSLGLDESSSGVQPMGIVVSNSGDVPVGDNLVIERGQEVLILIPEGVAWRGAPPAVRSLRHLAVRSSSAWSIDLAEVLKRLKAEFSIDVLLVEGGPSLNRALISCHLADELFLTMAPRLVGGEDLTILAGNPRLPQRASLALLSVDLAGDELFLRYAIHS